MRKSYKWRSPVLAGILLAVGLAGCTGLGSGGLVGFFRGNGMAGRTGGSPTNCRDGVWEGIGRGYRGNILVRVTVANGLIRDIEIAEHGEDPAVGGEAMAELLEQCLTYGPAEPDVVSGATESSQGFLAAVEDALHQGAR